MKSTKQEKKYKQYLKLIKEYNEVCDLIRKEPLIELEEPYQDGWILSYRLSDNISCSKLEREELKQLIKDSYSNSHVKDVRVIRCIRSGEESFKKRKKISLIKDYLPYPKMIKYEHINISYKEYYTEWNNRYYSSKDHYKLVLPSRYLKVKIKPNIITHTRGIHGDLESKKYKLYYKIYYSGQYDDCLGYNWKDVYPKYKDRTKVKNKINKFKNGDIEDIYNEKIPQEYYW